MLLPVLIIGLLHFYVESQRRLGRTRPAIMDGFGNGIVDNFPAGLAKAYAPINILAIHKKRFVQESHLIERFAPRRPEPAVQYVHFGDLISLEIRHQKSAENPGVGEQYIESKRAAKSAPQRGRSHV